VKVKIKEKCKDCGEKIVKFEMLIEPHTPSNSYNPCKECILTSGPMCIDRTYCEFKKTGKTWKKHLKELTE
jgi:hypothetical protein